MIALPKPLAARWYGDVVAVIALTEDGKAIIVDPRGTLRPVMWPTLIITDSSTTYDQETK